MSEIQDRLKTALSDRYEIQRELGHGGMATVYLAKDLKHERQVALKVLRSEIANALGSDRFIREVKIAAQLHHPHILPLYDSGEADGFFYYVMPYEEGLSLGEKISREGELPVREAVRLLRDVADALSYAHSQGVVHRDIKPDNVMLSGNHAIVTDFGIAKAVSEATGRNQLTTAGVALGTPTYMAPEQAAADPHIDHRADIYAFGAMAYELLAGKPPFSATTPAQILSAHVSEVPDSVSKHRASIPHALDQLVMRCLEKRPADRWQSAAELLQQLEALATPSGGTQPVAAVGVASHSTALRWGALSLAAVAVALGGMWVAGKRSEPAATEISATRLAVLPFSMSSSNAELDYLREGLVHLLSTAVDGAGEIRTVDPNSVLLAASGEPNIDPNQAREIAERFGAGMYVLGSITDAGGGRIQVRASLYQPTSQPVVTQVVGDGDNILEMTRSLARDLLAGYAGTTAGRIDSLAVVTTDSIDALKAYLRGLQEYRSRRWESAVNAFRTAVGIDTAFALAYYSLSRAASWAEQNELSIAAARTAIQMGGRLARRHRWLLEAALAFEEGRGMEAEEHALQVLHLYPDDMEALYLLGETRFHFGGFLGETSDGARDAFERLMSLDAGRADFFSHAYDLTMMTRDTLAIESVYSAHADATGDPSQRALLVDLPAAILRSDAEEATHLIAQVPTTFSGITFASWRLGVFLSKGPAGREIAELLTDENRPRLEQAFGHRFMAGFDFAMGKWNSARDELQLSATVNETEALLSMAWNTAAGSLSGSPMEIESLRERLLAWDAANSPACTFPDPTGFLCPNDGAHPQLRAYLLGRLEVRLGNIEAALGYAQALQQIGDPDNVPGLSADLSHGLRALAAYATGNPQMALAELEQTATVRDVYLIRQSSFYALTLERFLRAQVLSDLGRYEEALRWYSGLTRGGGFGVMLPLSHLHMGEIQEQLGNTDEAIEQYSRLVDWWSDADSQFQPVAEDVKGRIARLAGEPG